METERSRDLRNMGDLVTQHGRTFEAALVVVAAGTFGSTELLMRAAVDGAGVAVTSRLLAEEHLARGELVHILPGWIFSRYTIYAALPSGRMLPARTRVFLDFLTEHVPRAMAEKSGQLS